MTNPICELLKIQYPILQGGMGNISAPNLAAAVSEAGGLGTLGVGTLRLEAVKERVSVLKQQTDKPMCVNIPIAVHPQPQAIAEYVIQEKVAAVSLSAGNPKPFIPLFRDHDVKIICVVASVKQAKKAEAAGADIIVCEGYEAAGINSTLETTAMALVPQIVQAVSIPVVAAGGIGDGRGSAAALALGADGVQLGTRLIATEEAPYHLKYKELLKNASDDSTVVVGRAFNQVRRIMKTGYAEQLLAAEQLDADIDHYRAKTDESVHERGAVQGDLDRGFVNAGQISGLIEDCPTVADLFKTMVREAKTALVDNFKKLP